MRVFLISGLALFAAACGKSEDKTITTDTAAEQPAATELESATMLASGVFEGRSEHITTGGVSIMRDGDKVFVVLGEDFSLDGAPSPVLGFGNGEYDESSEFSVLNKITGRQVYELPATIDAAAYSEVYVWCKDFSVPLGVASLNEG